jgi:PhnB protein
VIVQFHPNLMFDGGLSAALKFYERCLHGKTVFLTTYQQAPPVPDTPLDWGDKIYHATFAVDGCTFSGSDVPPARYRKPQGFALQLNLSDSVEAERIFKSLAENGEIQLPLEETFWAASFGMVTDQFAIPWIINCEKNDK